MGLPWRESAWASSCEISLQMERGTEKLLLFFRGTLSGNFDFADNRERGTEKSMSCFIASVRSATESSLPLLSCAWYVLSSNHCSLRGSENGMVVIIWCALSSLRIT